MWENTKNFSFPNIMGSMVTQCENCGQTQVALHVMSSDGSEYLCCSLCGVRQCRDPKSAREQLITNFFFRDKSPHETTPGEYQKDDLQ